MSASRFASSFIKEAATGGDAPSVTIASVIQENTVQGMWICYINDLYTLKNKYGTGFFTFQDEGLSSKIDKHPVGIR